MAFERCLNYLIRYRTLKSKYGNLNYTRLLLVLKTEIWRKHWRIRFVCNVSYGAIRWSGNVILGESVMWWSDHVIVHVIISCPTSNHLVNAVNGRHIYILTATRSNTNIFHFWPCYINWIQKTRFKNVTGSFKFIPNRTFSLRLFLFCFKQFKTNQLL